MYCSKIDQRSEAHRNSLPDTSVNPFIVRAEEPGRPFTILQIHVLPYKILPKGRFPFFLAIYDLIVMRILQ